MGVNVMLYLKVSGSLVVGYQRIAKRQEISLGKLLRQALYQGLRTLQQQSSDIIISRQNKRVVLQKRQQFISDHWQTMSDEEMAVKLSLSTRYLAILRRGLGLLRPQGRKNIRERTEEKQFISDHWQTMSDEEMAVKLSSSISRIKLIRQKLKLLRPGTTKSGAIFLRDHHEWLKQQLTEEGLTLDEVGQIVHLTREGVRQIAVNMGILGEEKTPLWYVLRIAKRYGQLQLANSQWLQEQLEKKSLTILANELSIPYHALKMVLGRLDIKYQRPVSYQTIQTNCVSCGEPLIKRIYQRNRDQQLFFCNRVCFGKYIAHKGASTRRQRAQEKDQFIRDHWQTMSDEEMATKLSSSIPGIGIRRRGLGLLRSMRPRQSEDS